MRTCISDPCFIQDSADHPEASHCKDLHIDGEKEEASQHDQERPVEVKVHKIFLLIPN